MIFSGKQQPEKITKAFCYGMDEVRRNVHGTYSKHSLAKALDKAEMYAVNSGSAYDSRPLRRAKISALVIRSLHAERCKVNTPF